MKYYRCPCCKVVKPEDQWGTITIGMHFGQKCCGCGERITEADEVAAPEIKNQSDEEGASG
jgi:hypothetical protein